MGQDREQLSSVVIHKFDRLVKTRLTPLHYIKLFFTLENAIFFNVNFYKA
ncbi:hypothetical protein CKA32_005473 [Geitlerinema sp. FC II]|nr:hypothetical protein CKA32_005473 [Geitlerinema sp. FC II]